MASSDRDIPFCYSFESNARRGESVPESRSFFPFYDTNFPALSTAQNSNSTHAQRLFAIARRNPWTFGASCRNYERLVDLCSQGACVASCHTSTLLSSFLQKTCTVGQKCFDRQLVRPAKKPSAQLSVYLACVFAFVTNTRHPLTRLAVLLLYALCCPQAPSHSKPLYILYIKFHSSAYHSHSYASHLLVSL